MSDNVQLDYSVSTDPFPLQASPPAGAPQFCTLTVVASKPAAGNPVAVTGIRIAVPLGESGDALTAHPRTIHAVAPPGWTLQLGTAPGVYAFVPTPPAREVEVGEDSLVFVLNGVQVNRQPGIVRGLEVQEGSGGCRPPDCPTADLSGAVTKFPSGWRQVTFWADPPDVKAGEPTTLHWVGPAGAKYSLEWGTPEGVVRVPEPGKPALDAAGEYPGKDDPKLVPVDTTTYTLTVEETTVAGDHYTTQEQKAVTVVPGAPKITEFRGDVAYEPSGRCVLTFHWAAENVDRCRLTGAGGVLLEPSSPPEGHRVTVDDHLRQSAFELTAIGPGGRTTSTLALEWAVTEQITGFSAPSVSVALSPDGSLLFVAGSPSGVYATQPAPDVAPDPRSVRDGGGWYWYAGAITAAQTESGPLMAIASSGSGTWLAFGEIDAEGEPYIPTSLQVSGDNERIAGIALAPSGKLCYALTQPYEYEEGWMGLTAVERLDYQPPRQDPWRRFRVERVPAGIAVAADGAIYVATTTALTVYDDEFSQQEELKQPGSDTYLDVAVVGDLLYVAQTDSVLVLDRKTFKPIRDPLPFRCERIAPAPDGSRLYSGSSKDGTVSVIAPRTLVAR